EYLTEEPIGQEHTAAADIDCDNAVFGGDGLDAYRTGLFGDQGTLCIGLHGIQQPDGYLIDLRRPDRGRVKDLGTKIGELRGLLEGQLIDGEGLFYDARIIIMHTDYVGPYLAYGGIDRRGDQRSGVVASTSFQVVHLTARIAADIALRDEQRLCLM